MTTKVELTQHDSRLISAAILYVLGIAGSGAEAAGVVRLLTAKGRSMLNDATVMLSSSVEGAGGDDVVTVSGDTFSENLARLKDIGLLLMGDKQVEVTPVAQVQKLDSEGNVTGPKLYQLWVTHDEIHLLHWAIMFAEGGLSRDPMAMLKALTVYAEQREHLDGFVDKFNQVHEAARVEDGEGSFSSDDSESK